jgi:hypothetical protein
LLLRIGRKEWMDEIIGWDYASMGQILKHFTRMTVEQKINCQTVGVEDSMHYSMGLKGPEALRNLLPPDSGVYAKMTAVYRGLNELVDAMRSEQYHHFDAAGFASQVQ